jgi:ribosomal protein S14
MRAENSSGKRRGNENERAAFESTDCSKQRLQWRANVRREERRMTSTFLHDDNKVPPDEVVEREAPPCKICGQQMWVVRVETSLSDNGALSKRDYECSRCGTKQSVQTSSPFIAPSSPARGN